MSDFAVTHGVDDDDLTHFLTALGEALANAIEHSRAAEPIDIEIRVGSGQISALVRDNGVGFVTEPTPEANLPDPHAERGRGLPIMRRCCDVFTIESTPGRGTSVRIGRYLRTEMSAGAGLSNSSHVA